MKKLSKEQLAQLGKECLSNNINRTARIILKLYDEKSRPHGFLTKQVQTLYKIAFWEPVSINTLAEKSDMDRTTVIRNCKVLEKDGFITIKTGKDKRYRLIELTEKGWDTVNSSFAIWEEQQAEIAEILGKVEMEKLVELLRYAGKKLRRLND